MRALRNLAAIKIGQYLPHYILDQSLPRWSNMWPILPNIYCYIVTEYIIIRPASTYIDYIIIVIRIACDLHQLMHMHAFI